MGPSPGSAETRQVLYVARLKSAPALRAGQASQSGSGQRVVRSTICSSHSIGNAFTPPWSGLGPRLGSGKQEELTRRLSAVLGELQRGRGYAERVLVKADGRVTSWPWKTSTGWRQHTTMSGSMREGSSTLYVKPSVASKPGWIPPGLIGSIGRQSSTYRESGSCSRHSTANTRSFSPPVPSSR